MSQGNVFVYLPDEMQQPQVIRLESLLVAGLRPILGDSIENTTILCQPLYLPPVAELASGKALHSPALINSVPEVGFLMLTVIKEKKVIYHHAHTVEDAIGPPLLEHLRQSQTLDDIPYIRYRLDLGIPSTGRRDPQVNGKLPVSATSKRRPRFQMRLLPDPELPHATLADWAINPPSSPAADRTVTVLLHQDIADALNKLRPFSRQWEEGGFLLGRAFRDAAREGQFLVEIVAAPPAKHTEGSLVHLDFTGDSFAHVKRQLAHKYAGTMLLGWYHTHLFPASDIFGLSTIDVTLHHTTFKRPWQIAGLINFEDDGSRILRFYGGANGRLVQYPFFQVSIAQAQGTADSTC